MEDNNKKNQVHSTGMEKGNLNPQTQKKAAAEPTHVGKATPGKAASAPHAGKVAGQTKEVSEKTSQVEGTKKHGA